MRRGLHFHNVPSELRETLERLGSVNSNDLKEIILGLLWSGRNLKSVAEELQRKGIRRRAFSEEEIAKAAKELKNFGLVDDNGYITKEGLKFLP